MPAPVAVSLSPAQMQELARVRDHDPTPYVRERAAAILKAGAGQSPRAEQGLGANKRSRIAACLDVTTGRVVSWRRRRFDRKTLVRFYAAVAAAYPAAEAVVLAQDNWPVHTHPDVLAALPPRLTLLPLPTSAPWTNPVEDLWRHLLADVLHHHAFGDDWAGLQAAGERWLARWADGSPDLLRLVGLCPD